MSKAHNIVFHSIHLTSYFHSHGFKLFWIEEFFFLGSFFKTILSFFCVCLLMKAKRKKKYLRDFKNIQKSGEKIKFLN